MEWQQLEYFKVTAELQHITLASQKLNLTQPALSRSIARLENELGVPLFDRQGRQIILNHYGKRFLEHVNIILLEYEEAKLEIQSMLNPEKGQVSLGFLHTLGESFIPELIRAFGLIHPGITFELHQNGTRALIDQLIRGEIDLCFSYPPENSNKIEWNYLWDEELQLVVPVNHPLADENLITLEMLKNETFITFKLGFGLRKITDDLLTKAGICPKIAFEGEEVHTICGLVAAGLGIAIVPKIKGPDRDNISILHINSPEFRRNIGILNRKDGYLSPSTRLFLDFVIDYFNKTELQRM